MLLRKENFKGAIYHQTKRVASYLQSVRRSINYRSAGQRCSRVSPCPPPRGLTVSPAHALSPLLVSSPLQEVRWQRVPDCVTAQCCSTQCWGHGWEQGTSGTLRPSTHPKSSVPQRPLGAGAGQHVVPQAGVPWLVAQWYVWHFPMAATRPALCWVCRPAHSTAQLCLSCLSLPKPQLPLAAARGSNAGHI